MDLPTIETKALTVTDIDTSNVLFLNSEEMEEIMFKVSYLNGEFISQETFTLYPGRNILALDYLEEGEYLIEVNGKSYRYSKVIETL